MSEHHNSDSIVGTAPEILMAAIAATTTRIRVGSAGVMLPHYAALKVAEQFRVLEAIAPGRIDLGVGRAPGTDRLTAYALNPYANAADEFPRRCATCCLASGERLPDDHPLRAIRAHPAGATQPEVWILGSSDYGARLAAHFGLPYAFAYFFSDGRGVEEALRLYRDRYRPSADHPEPKATICVWALAADSEEEARRLLHTREHWRVGFEQGLRRPLLPPDEAAAQPYAPAEHAIVERFATRRSSARPTTSRNGCPSSRRGSHSTSSSSSRGPTIPRRAIARTSCWRRPSGCRRADSGEATRTVLGPGPRRSLRAGCPHDAAASARTGTGGFLRAVGIPFASSCETDRARFSIAHAMSPPRRPTLLVLLLPFAVAAAHGQGFKFSQPDDTERAAQAAREDRIAYELSTPCRADLKGKKIMVDHRRAAGQRLRHCPAAELRPALPGDQRAAALARPAHVHARGDQARRSRRPRSTRISRTIPTWRLSAAKRLGASFVLRGLITSEATMNPIIAVNQVSVSMGFTLTGSNGRIISDVGANAASYAGANVGKWR